MKQNKFSSIVDEMVSLKENGSMLSQFSEEFEKRINLQEEADKMDLKKSVVNNISKDTKFEDLIFVKYAFGISDKDDFYNYLLSDIDDRFKKN